MTRFPYERVILSDGATLAYVDEGAGPPMVMLHGFVGTAHRHLEALIQEFRSDFRVLAPDLRGYGASQPPPRDFPPTFYERDAEDIEEFLDRLHVKSTVLLGFSDGGESALVLAGRRPDLVRGLIVWGAFGLVQPSAIQWLNSLPPVESWGNDLEEWRLALVHYHGEWQWPGLVTHYIDTVRGLVASGWKAGLECAPLITCPVLQIHGETEERANRAEAVQLAAAIPHGRVAIVSGAGHFVQFERNEELVGLIRSFVEGLDG